MPDLPSTLKLQRDSYTPVSCCLFSRAVCVWGVLLFDVLQGDGLPLCLSLCAFPEDARD